MSATFQDLLDDLTDDRFIGRGEQLTLFERALTATRPPFLILAVCGQGGVGKSALLRQFCQIATDHGALIALVNEDYTDLSATLKHLAHQLGEAGYALKSFEERFRKYRELRGQIEADPKAPPGILDFGLRTATRIAWRGLKHVPIAGDAADVLLTPATEDAVAEQVSAWGVYIARKFTNKDERDLLLEPEFELTRHFIADLDQQAQTKRIVLSFDTYEKTCTYLEDWLLNLLGGKFGTFSGRISFVIAGRRPLGQGWTRYKPAIQQIELSEFTEAEAREYLHRYGITAEVQVSQMLTLSKSLPVLLALLANAPGGMTDVSGDAMERFLHGMSSADRGLVLAASVPRFFNEDILAAVVGAESVPKIFEWLTECSFVRSGVEGWFYHDVVRSLMLRYLRRRSPHHYAAIHGKLVDYYRTQAEAMKLAEAKQGQNETWRKYEMERLYHCLSQNPTGQLKEVLGSFLANWADQSEDNSTSIPQYCANILMQVSNETHEPTLNIWVERLPCLIAFFNGAVPEAKTLDKVLQAATSLCEFGELTARLQSEAYHLRGRLYHIANNYPAALADYDQAVKLQPENASNYLSRGFIYYFETQEFLQALADYNQAINLQPGMSDNYYWRGKTYFAMLDYPAALADFNKSIELQPDDNGSYTWRARIYKYMGKDAAALADFAKDIELLNIAIELHPNRASNYQSRGIIYREIRNYSAALDDLTKAVELAPDNLYNYSNRGRVYLDMKQFTAAFADFNKAIELRSDESRCYLDRGYAYIKIKDYPAAIADFSHAIGLQPHMSWNYEARARSYFKLKDYSAAMADLSRAIELQPKDEGLYFWCGRVYLAMGEPLTALSEFDRAIELEPEEGNYYAWRGRAYLEISETENAQSDFAQVEHLLDESGWPPYSVAGGYVRKGQLTEALVWLRHALKRDNTLTTEVSTDNDFDLVRENKEFKALLAEFEDKT